MGRAPIKLPLYGQLKEHVSFSELRLFNECQWKWLLKKVCGLGSDDRSFQMDYGKAVHSGLEMLYDPASPLDVEKASAHASEMYGNALRELKIEHPTDLEEAERIKQLIPRFYEDCLKCPELQGITTLRSEMKLMQDIDRTDGLYLKFKGFIDITFVKKRGKKSVIYIADFKTCQWGWPWQKFQDIEVISQILLYKHFFCKLLGADPKNVRVAFILLKKKPKQGDLTAQVCDVSAGPKATEKALKYLQDTITAMHRYEYTQNLDACKRIWTDQATKEKRSVCCEFLGTELCPGSAEGLAP